MGRKLGEPESGGRSFLILLSLSLLSCSLAYLAIFFTFRSVDQAEPARPGLEGGGGGGGGGVENCCEGVPNLELWGTAVKWGTEFKFNSSDGCCRACRSMCGGGDGPCLCDSWVFCGDRERCGPHFGECWLKKQKDSLNPEKQDSGEKVIWTSGLIYGKGEGIIGLGTEYGVLHMKLLPHCAPRSVAHILELLTLRHCAGCHFYRAEGRGNLWDAGGSHIVDAPLGPPFALIQGTLAAEGVSFNPMPKEACPTLKRGSVAWIDSGPEFFISLANHDEWKKEYTVFASILPEDMKIAEKIADLPTKGDSWSNIQVKLLETPVSLSLRRITDNSL